MQRVTAGGFSCLGTFSTLVCAGLLVLSHGAQAQDANNEEAVVADRVQEDELRIADEVVEEEDDLNALYGLLQSEAFVTVATKREESTQGAPSIVTVISRVQIEAMGYQSVGEALREVPGLYVIDDLITENVAVRGVFGGADSWSRAVKVLVDGIPATEYSTGGNFLGREGIPISVVESIEVVRGPASPLYGANAFLGVINIVTRTPEEGVHGTMTGRAGFIQDNFSYGGSMTVSARTGDDGPVTGWMTGTIRTDWLDRSGLELPNTSPSASLFAGQASENDVSQPLSGFLRGHLKLGPAGTLDATLLLQQIDSQADFNEVGLLTHNSVFARNNMSASLSHRLDIELGPGVLTFNTTGQLTFGSVRPSERTDPTDAFSFVLRRERSSDALLLVEEVSYALGDHLFLVGVDYLTVEDTGDAVWEEDRVNRNRTFRSAGRPVSYDNTGVYGQAVFVVTEDLSLTGNLRFDANSLWEDSLSWRFGVAWQPTDETYAKLLYGSSFVAPAPTQLSLVPLRSGGPIGSTNLNPQRAQTVELAGGYTVSGTAAVDLTLFFTQVDDRVEFVDTGLNIESRNLTTSRTFGAELAGQWRGGPFMARGSVSLALTELEEPNPLPSYWFLLYGDAATGSGLPGAPAVMGHLMTGVSFPEHFFQATLAVNGFSGRKSSFSNTERSGEAYLLPAYVTVDINLRTLQLQDAIPFLDEISLQVRNLLDTRYEDVGNLGSDLPTIGRTIMLQTRVGL